MHILSHFQRHRRYAVLASAYADGEDLGADRERFEAHLAACDKCAAQIEVDQRLKAAVSSLPTISATRSFAITPDMLGAATPKPLRRAAPTSTPLYLAVTRIAAGFALFAFVSVFAVSLLNDSASDEQATPEQLSSGSGAPLSDSAAGAESAPNATDKDASDKSAAATPVPALAPATGAGVEGQAVASPAAASVVPPDRDSAGVTPGEVAPTANDRTAGEPGVLGDAYEVTASSTDADASEGDSFPWVIVLGSLAGATVGLLYVLEMNRRKRA